MGTITRGRIASMPTRSSSPFSVTAVTTKPGNPSSASSKPVPSAIARASFTLEALISHKNGELPRLGGDAIRQASSSTDHAPRFIGERAVMIRS